MKGEGVCEAVIEDNAEYPNHCIHYWASTGDLVCCWCGDVFVLDDSETGNHGQYAVDQKIASEPEAQTVNGDCDEERAS